VLSQNSKQFNMGPNKRFSYSLYDALGRVYEAGELEDAQNAPDRFIDLPATEVNGALLPQVIDPEVLKDWVLTRPRTEVTRTHYDEALSSLSIPGFTQQHLRLRVASTMFYDEWNESVTPPDPMAYQHATHYSYDIHGNVKTLIQDHPQLGVDGGAIAAGCVGCIDHRYKRMDYRYDLISGNVRQVDYQKYQPDSYHHRYEYDADNRITEVETSADAQNWHHDARYIYYPHGPLQRVELGEHLVQGTDYAYTLQGWLKGINGDRLNPSTDMGRDGDATVVDNPNLLTGRDAYALSLGYYGDADYKAIASAYDSDIPANVVQRPFAHMGTSGTLNTEHTPLYNGNIAHTVNTLQHFGLWDATNGDQGQVLAMVYRYDQLNRLRSARGLVGLGNTNTWDGVNDSGPNEDNRYRSEYEYDANGNILTTNRWDYEGDHYDEFAYKYQRQSGTARLLRNRLYQLFDEADPTNLHANTTPDGSEDIGFLPETTTFDEEAAELNGLHNYHYDALGNLIHDEREQINVIEWTVAGKVKSVSRTLGSTRDPLSFGYGASGQRILKQVGTNPDGGNGYREHYIRDAQGNIMATYRYTNNDGASLKLNERPVYGSSRLGSLRTEVELHTLPSFDPATANPVQQIDLNYELTDHLGNVCAVVTGRLLDGNGGGTPKQAELVSAQGYEPGGSLLPGRNYSSSTYNYGFNGMRKDDEIHGATGTSYDFGARLYDPRVGRWLSLDPLSNDYPAVSPYVFALNSPIQAMDPDGKRVRISIWTRVFQPKIAKAYDVLLRTEEARQQLSPYMTPRQAQKYGATKTGVDLSRKVDVVLKGSSEIPPGNGLTSFSISTTHGKPVEPGDLDVGSNAQRVSADSKTKAIVRLGIGADADYDFAGTLGGYLQRGTHEFGVHLIPVLNFLKENMYDGDPANLQQAAREADNSFDPDKSISAIHQHVQHFSGVSSTSYNAMTTEVKQGLQGKDLDDYNKAETNDQHAKDP